MKPLWLRAVNTYSFAEVSLTEEDFQPGVIAGIGDNRDQGGNNGTGKSNLGKIIFYAKKGREIDGESKEKITKWGTEGHCVDYAELRNGIVYRIKRYDNWTPDEGNICYEAGESFAKTRGNTGLKFWIDGELQVGATQATIESVMTESADIIKSTTLIQQRSGSPFLTATDVKRKERISEIFNNEAYDIGKEKADRDLKDLEKKINVLKQRLDSKNELIKNQEMNLERAKKQESAFIEVRNKKIQTLKKELSGLKAKLESLVAIEIESVDTEALESSEQQLKQELTKVRQLLKNANDSELLNEIRTKLSELNARRNNIENKSTSLDGVILTLEKSLDERLVSEMRRKIESLELEASSLVDVKECSGIIEIKNQMRGLQDKAAEIKSRIKMREAALAELEHSLVCPTCKRAWDEATLAQKNKEISAVAAEISDLQTSLSDNDSELAANQTVVASHEAWEVAQKKKQEVKALNDKIASADNVRSEIEEASVKLISFKVRIAEIDHAIEDSRILEDSEIKNLKEKLASKELEALNLEQALDELQRTIKNGASQNNKKQSHEKDISSLQAEIKRAKKDGQTAVSEVNPHLEIIENIKKDIDVTKADIDEIEQNIKSAEDDRSYVEYWSLALGAAGIKSFISDDLIIALNERIQDYLIPLYGGSLFIEFTSESMSQKGAVSNKIGTKITYSGHETTQNLISGGELKRIEFAINLALADVAEMYSGIQSKVRFLDEPFDGMCSTGQIKALKMLEKISEERDICYILISHDPGLQNICKKSFISIKENGTSRIVKSSN